MSANKVVYGILNWNRDITSVVEPILDEDIILCTNVDNNIDLMCAPESVESEPSSQIFTIKADSNIAKCKNDIIKMAKEQKYRWLVLMEDDIIIKDKTVVERYIEEMTRFNLGLIFYGYHKGSNCVLDGVPNPGIITKIGDSDEDVLNFCRFPCGAFIVIDLEKNDQLFDEDLVCLELEEYMQRCANEKIIQFNGFFLDISNSSSYFDVSNSDRNRIKTKEAVDLDKKGLTEKKAELKLEANADVLINWIVDILKKEKKN